jgi:hypothetical protein
LGVERALALARLVSLIVDGMQAKPQSNRDESQAAHADAQAFERRSNIGKGTRCEVE